MGLRMYMDPKTNDAYAKRVEMIEGSLKITPPPPPKADYKKPERPNFSWRFAATAANAPDVSYYIPARRIHAKMPAGTKQKPWGVDCYAIGRLLFEISQKAPLESNLDKTMRAEAANVVSSAES